MTEISQLEGQNLEQQTGKSLEGKISSLETQIISQFKISYTRLPELVKFSGEKGREALKEELKSELSRNAGETLVDTLVDYDVLASKIEELGKLKDELKKQVRAGIEGLNAELNKLAGNNELTKPKIASKIFSEKIIARAENPENIGDQIVGLGVGATETIAVAGKFVGETAFGVLKSPYDLYQIATGKAKYDGFDKV